MYIFISYAKKDSRAFAEGLFSSINAVQGINAWYDASLEPIESWVAQIEEEIDKADLVIVLLSPDVNRKPPKPRSFVQREIVYAQQQHKTILPVMVQTTRLPLQLADHQFVDASDDAQRAIREIVQYVCKLGGITSGIESTQEVVGNKTIRVFTNNTNLLSLVSRSSRTMRFVFVGTAVSLLGITLFFVTSLLESRILPNSTPTIMDVALQITQSPFEVSPTNVPPSSTHTITATPTQTSLPPTSTRIMATATAQSDRSLIPPPPNSSSIRNATRTPTQIPVPTPAQCRAMSDVPEGSNLRAQPSTSSEVIGVLYAGNYRVVTGKYYDRPTTTTWYQLGSLGPWISEDAVDLEDWRLCRDVPFILP